MKNIKLFIELTRLSKPIGFMLLFWPCIWGLTLSYNFNLSLNLFIFYGFLFFSGSVLMRSAGCIVNDISDKNFDKLVERTKKRPIASEKISIKLAIIYATILCVIAFLVLINFNKFTILMALISMPLAFTYPLMKRFTYWPQLFLGFTFNFDQFEEMRDRFYKIENSLLLGQELDNEKEYFRDNFSLDKVFKHVILYNEGEEIPWHYQIDSWDSYCKFLSSEEKNEMRHPGRLVISYRELNPIGVDNEEE